MSLRALCKTEGLALGFSKALDTRRAVYISEEVKGAYPKLVQLICDMCVSEKNSWTLVANKIAFQHAKTKASGFPSQSSKAGFLLCQVLNHGPPCAQQHSDRGGEKLAKQNQNEGEAPRSNQDTNTDTDTHRHTDTQTHRHTDTHTHTHTQRLATDVAEHPWSAQTGPEGIEEDLLSLSHILYLFFQLCYYLYCCVDIISSLSAASLMSPS